MSNIEKLIGSLSEAAAPVQPLRHPLLRAALWLVFAMSVIVGLAYFKGIHHDLGLRFSRRDFETEWIASVLTGIGATVAAFYVSLPDRSPWWSLLALPGLAMWLLSTGYGCYADWIRLGPNGFILGTSFECLGFIALSTIPLSAALLYLLRYAAPVRPVMTTILATFSVAALGGAGQSLTHHFDTTLMILVWHAGTTAVLLGLARFVGPRFLQRLWNSTTTKDFAPISIMS